MKEEHKLQALIDQWKEINGFINKLDTELWVVFTILASVYGAVITAFKGNLCPSQIADAKFWMLILLPIVSAAIIGCMANNPKHLQRPLGFGSEESSIRFCVPFCVWPRGAESMWNAIPSWKRACRISSRQPTPCLPLARWEEDKRYDLVKYMQENCRK